MLLYSIDFCLVLNLKSFGHYGILLNSLFECRWFLMFDRIVTSVKNDCDIIIDGQHSLSIRVPSLPFRFGALITVRSCVLIIYSKALWMRSRYL